MKNAGPNAYRDIEAMMNQALANGGAIFHCHTEAEAIRVVQRMNQFRIMQRKIMYENAKRFVPRENDNLNVKQRYEEDVYMYKAMVSMYDNLIIRRPDRANRVIVEIKPDRPFTHATKLDGTPLDFDVPKPVETTPESKDSFDDNPAAFLKGLTDDDE